MIVSINLHAIDKSMTPLDLDHLNSKTISDVHLIAVTNEVNMIDEV